MLFSLAEKKIIQFNYGVSKVSISQNRVLLKRKFSSFMISTNQNRASIVKACSAKLESTNQNLALFLSIFQSF